MLDATFISLKSTKGFHLVRIGRGCWVFNTLTEALNYIEAVRY